MIVKFQDYIFSERAKFRSEKDILRICYVLINMSAKSTLKFIESDGVVKNAGGEIVGYVGFISSKKSSYLFYTVATLKFYEQQPI